jgi:protein-disulfide isomerase
MLQALPRRLALGLFAGLAASRFAWADEADPRMAERSVGRPDAKVTVIEFFSFTCPHCARFSRDVFPQVRAKLIEPGVCRWVYRDFPLDNLALTAAMVARALVPERYEAIASALFATQDRWAFDRGANTTEQLWKIAALAGMSRATFDATITDEKLRTEILTAQKQGQDEYHIDSTPTFIIGGKNHAGEIPFDKFEQFVRDAVPAG